MRKLLILACAAAIGFAANAATINLSTVTADTTIDDGTTLTGTSQAFPVSTGAGKAALVA